MKTLGILAGGGMLPVRLIEACRRHGRSHFVVAFKDQTPTATVSGAPHGWFRLGGAGAVLDRLRRERVEEVVLAGSIHRPTLSQLRPDFRAAWLLAGAGWQALGDDGLLRAIVAALEAEGFRVTGADTIVADLLAPEGPLGRCRPSPADWSDIRRGIEVARELGLADIGQAAVVRGGLVLGVEGADGTDALVQRCVSGTAESATGVLVKSRKPGQETRVDLPAIGPATVAEAAAAGLAGIAVEAGATLVIDREETVRRADAAGLFIVGVAAPA